MPSKTILVLSGTFRPDSNALKISKVLAGLYQKAGVTVDLLSLSELPAEAFLPTIYATKPASVVALQKRVLDAAGIHLVTPEYNGSFPGVLKHFIDLLKFPESFENKPVAFTGEAAGVWGGLRAVEQLQAIFSYRNAHICSDRVFIPGVNGKLDAAGNVTDADILARLTAQTKAFAGFVTKIGA